MSDADELAVARRWLSVILDAAVEQCDGDSLVPTDDLNDARAQVFGVRIDDDETMYTCSRCEKEVPGPQAERVGLKVFCRECADEHMIDDAIRQLVTVPGRS